MSSIAHGSETAVRKYLLSNSVLLENVSKVLDPPKTMKFEVTNQEKLSNNSEEFQNQETLPLNPQSVFNNYVFNFQP